ncbi:PREDICTED: uncharacterized protein LOC104817197 [Tarenaya hassleriana]|uniref:uncharacterized protein LOC104817197 n=1 Tax=Tarenaya hassleriana TaxID=28532 RepID=UPI00053C530B|nr:PREDICTED: uncharacterized protein LOC104817197 [Tarenaya hassleriana]
MGGSTMNGSEVGAGGSRPVAMAKTSNLNPSAPEWRPNGYDDNEDLRSLFVTFSNGYPLNEGQISTFFTRKYGACVERVYVHRTRTVEGGRRKKPPLFGKVTFKWPFMVQMVMSGEDKVCFRIDGRPLWCKSFDPSRLHHSSSSPSSGELHGGSSDISPAAAEE